MRIHHIALICSDYAERDSWKLDLGIGSHYALELFSFPNPPPRPGRPVSAEACGLRHLAFAVADVAAKRAQLQGLGVDCEAIRTDEYTGKDFFFIQDPDKLPIEFYQE